MSSYPTLCLRFLQKLGHFPVELVLKSGCRKFYDSTSIVETCCQLCSIKVDAYHDKPDRNGAVNPFSAELRKSAKQDVSLLIY